MSVYQRCSELCVSCVVRNFCSNCHINSQQSQKNIEHFSSESLCKCFARKFKAELQSTLFYSVTFNKYATSCVMRALRMCSVDNANVCSVLCKTMLKPISNIQLIAALPALVYTYFALIPSNRHNHHRTTFSIPVVLLSCLCKMQPTDRTQ